jgi:hypothetical protein
LRGLGKSHQRSAVQRFLMAQAVPLMMSWGSVQIREIRFISIADIEEIAQHGDRITLFTRPQQFANRDIKRFAQQIQQRGLQRRDRVDPQFKGPGPLPKVSKSAAWLPLCTC